MFEKSVANYQKAAELEPNDDTIYYGMAAGQYVLGRYKEARENCEKALVLNKKNENAKKLLERIP